MKSASEVVKVILIFEHGPKVGEVGGVLIELCSPPCFLDGEPPLQGSTLLRLSVSPRLSPPPLVPRVGA